MIAILKLRSDSNLCNDIAGLTEIMYNLGYKYPKMIRQIYNDFYSECEECNIDTFAPYCDDKNKH